MANLPSNPSKLPKHLLGLLLGVLLLFFAFLAGYGWGAKSPADGGYQAGYEAARQKLAATGMFRTTEIKSLVGTVASVGEASVDITTAPQPTNPLDDPLPSSRRVLVGSDTKLHRSEAKSNEEMKADLAAYADEMKKYDADMKAGKVATFPSVPSSYEIVEIELSDIKTGDQISVTAAEDISYQESFTATEIVATQPTAAVAPPSAAVE